MLILSRRKLLASGAAALAYNKLVAEEARAQSPCGSFYPTAPAPAVAKGRTQLIWEDDFTVQGLIAPPGSTAMSGFNWWAAPQATITGSNPCILVLPNATADSISNGNTTGSAYQSAVGGLIKLRGPNAPGNGNVTISSTPFSTQKVSNPGFGCWGPDIYMEVLCQFNPQCTANNQWFAPLWMNSQVQNLSNPTGQGTYEEIDPIENYCGNFGFNPNNSTFSAHQWNNGVGQVAGGGGSLGNNAFGNAWHQLIWDAEWHVVGFSWEATSPTTGTWECFVDNQPSVLFPYSGAGFSSAAFPVGAGGTPGWGLLQTGYPLYALSGGPPGYDMYLDYIRVWC